MSDTPTPGDGHATAVPPLGNVIAGQFPLDAVVEHRILDDGQAFVLLRVEHPTGSSVFAMTPQGAVTLGDRLKGEARRAASGLRLPPSGLVLPNGAGG